MNKSGKSGYPCLVPDLGGKAVSFSPLSMVFAVDLLYMTFVMLRYVPSISSLLRVFIINGCLILSDAFYASIEMIMCVLSLILLIWCITLIVLGMVNHSCIHGINPTWSRCMILLMYFWIQFANILLRIFEPGYVFLLLFLQKELHKFAT